MKYLLKNILIKYFIIIFFNALIFISFGTEVYKSYGETFNQNFSHKELYSALESQDSIEINRILIILNKDTTVYSMAYSGALLMKKSALKKSATEKTKLFKEGKIRMENAIIREQNNYEFHFLRLIIQENCPRFLNYHFNLNEDAQEVKLGYNTFPIELKKIVLDYSKTSKALKTSDFSN